ncbi:peptidase M61 [Ignavibacteria bacterium]|nr:hypothetical protein [Bacteroidota bacterium]MCZ2132692.1 hypothetical protein [Bacteroidota bacterium]
MRLLILSLSMIGVLAVVQPLAAQKSPDFAKSPSIFSIDLRNTENDRIAVSVVPPASLPQKDTVIYVMPAIVPGTYSRYDFGRFITDIRAVADDGSELPVKHRSVNEIAVAQTAGRRLKKLEYKVNDSFDDDGKPVIFQPCGTNFQKDTNYLLNFPGVCGYFDGLKLMPIILEIDKPEYLFAATSLQVRSRTAERDVFGTASYDELADNPVMYSRPDTVVYREGNAVITVAVYSANGKVNAAQVAEYLRPLTGATHRFLGKMPVDRYSFIMYFADPSRSDIVRNITGTGALEHSYCSVYFFTEPRNVEALENTIQHVAAHEFLHILVPLHLHSREIDDFDFLNPKMSAHLWLYEGVTEYFANLSLLKGGLITPDDFRTIIRQKLSMSAMMSPKPFSMTEFSRNVLTEENQRLYPIIYAKGAVSGFLLDILLNESTQGKLSLLGLTQRLATEYGPSKPFEDKELFEIIGKISPSAEQYLRRYADSANALPLGEVFDKIGWEYSESQNITTYSFGTLKFKPNPDTTALDVTFSFSDNKLKLEDGDEIISVNGQKIKPESYKNLMDLLTNPATGNTITTEVERGGHKLALDGTPTAKEQKKYHVLTAKQDVTEKQANLLRWVLEETR